MGREVTKPLSFPKSRNPTRSSDSFLDRFTGAVGIDHQYRHKSGIRAGAEREEAQVVVGLNS